MLCTAFTVLDGSFPRAVWVNSNTLRSLRLKLLSAVLVEMGAAEVGEE